MNYRKIYPAVIIVLFSMFTSPVLAVDGEYLTAQELQDIMRGDNLWCYDYTESCAWIEDIDLIENKLTQWLKEYDSGDKIMIKFAPLRLIDKMMCDEKAVLNENFSVQHYIDPTHSWQAVEKITEIFEYPQQHIDKTFADYNQFASCYSYIDRGFTHKGYRQIEQVIFLHGPNGRRLASTDIISIIPKLQMHGVKLTAKP